MKHFTILCVEDEPEVRDALVRDLAPFSTAFRFEAAEDVAEARDVLAECARDNTPVGLVLCDHLMPGETGVDFLVELNHTDAYRAIRKVLITGQAGQDDTIRAINDAGIHQYIAKPWSVKQLTDVVRAQLTEFVLAEVDDLLPYIATLDGARIMEHISRSKADR